MTSSNSYDAVVVGAGPVGSTAALALAHQGARVALLDGNPDAALRLAGEWLHPAAVDVLTRLGVPMPEAAEVDGGRGFIVHPEDGSEPIELPYDPGLRGWAIHHRPLADHLRQHAAAHPAVDLLPWTRMTELGEPGSGRVVCQRKGTPGELVLHAPRVIAADGRSSLTRKLLGLPAERYTLSRMAGILLHDHDLSPTAGVPGPGAGYGHVFLGGPGPVLAYAIGGGHTRLALDVPLTATHLSTPEALYDAYAPALPPGLRPAMREALAAGRLLWAKNQVRSRVHFGRPDAVLVGDACGFYHPLTAAGMMLGFGDAWEVAQPRRWDAAAFAAYERKRRRDTRVGELLATVLYEVFSGDGADDLAVRRAIYAMWRGSRADRVRTLRYLSGQDGRARAFAATFLKAVGYSAADLGWRAARRGAWRQAASTARELLPRVGWLGGTLAGRREPAEEGETVPRPQRGWQDPAPARPGRPRPVREDTAEGASSTQALPSQALSRGAHALAALAREDGGWEGEVVWNPMLTAQYILAAHVMGRELSSERRQRALRYFEETRLEDGAAATQPGVWALHPQATPSLFVTTLVYVAARLCGVEAEASLLAGARRMIEAEGGVEAIPSWGKTWLAMVGLYDWRGVPAVPPEAWALPRALPVHPARFYSHTRIIYMAMASVFAQRVTGPITPTIEALRDELFPAARGGYARVRWDRARAALRAGDLYAPPTLGLRAVRAASVAWERVAPRSFRRRVLDELHERLRWELRSTSYAGISPVSGLLAIVALWDVDAADPDLERAWRGFEHWVWEDDEGGLRVAGARSATWDTSFALQALAEAAEAGVTSPTLEDARRAGGRFLAAQQMTHVPAGWFEQDRLNPDGGFCFAEAWHGWPVSDCTAEAVEALNKTADAGLLDPTAFPRHRVGKAVDFVLRCQNADGGFGSYEARRSPVSLEWMNPAEMFGDSMLEASYAECTASSLAALHGVAPTLDQEHRLRAEAAAAEAVARLRAVQRQGGADDGAWEGAWGVGFLYGTMFGLRGLRAAGVPPTDPAIKRAARWILDRQREDGGWGESHEGLLTGRYVEAPASHPTQTAWALLALTLAETDAWPALERGAAWLARAQRDDGGWPDAPMVGVFFRTALLDYRLYQHVFPVWALAAVERRRQRRALEDAPRQAAPAAFEFLAFGT